MLHGVKVQGEDGHGSIVAQQVRRCEHVCACMCASERESVCGESVYKIWGRLWLSQQTPPPSLPSSFSLSGKVPVGASGGHIPRAAQPEALQRGSVDREQKHSVLPRLE